MFIKRLVVIGSLLCALGAGCSSPKVLSIDQASSPSPEDTSLPLPLQTPLPADLPRSKANVVIADPRFPTSTTGFAHSLTLESSIRPNEECLYFTTTQRDQGFNVVDFLIDSFSPSSPLQVLDVGSYSLEELTEVNKTSQAFSQATQGTKLETSITCKISSPTQGPVYLVMGTHAVSSVLEAQVHLLQSSSTHLAKYAPSPNKAFLILTPTVSGLTVRRDLAGVPALSALGREDLFPCSGSLVEEYQLHWQCGIGYIKNADGTTSLRTREWSIRLAKDDTRPDVSFVTEENVGTEEENGPFFFYAGSDYMNDTERLEWNGRSWKVVDSSISR